MGNENDKQKWVNLLTVSKELNGDCCSFRVYRKVHRLNLFNGIERNKDDSKFD